ncbi:formyl transferase domain protein [Bordetella bronchiseptica MBORD635]|uniref:formyltransferase family protein n=1 Tax=Bordetella bronchiseptica TaxID=518 RepID=UPI000460B253|nr:formyltransferase family protein [Bordetella bronchiseptica]KDC74986.1 formyl transferase domain protein [Bordetella bronchiseptica MBORD635]
MTTQVSKPRLALFVDNVGAAELWPAIGTLAPVCALVAAGIRPQYIESLSALADEMGCPLLIQPRHDAPTYAGFVQQLAQTAPTRILVHSYSMILRPDVLSLVDYDALNIHAALLPRNRGPNPVQWALIHDEAETGVTLHYLDDGLDTGDIVAQERIGISDADTWVTLSKRLQEVTRRLIARHMPTLLDGKLPRALQAGLAATKNSRLTAESPRLDPYGMSDRELFNWVRGQVAPLGGAYVERGTGERLHVREYVALGDIPALRARLLQWLEGAR